MKKGLLLLVILKCCLTFSQEPKFGELTPFEKEFVGYEKDTTAMAVYLYERGDNYFDIRNDRIWLITEYHAKIKILKKDGYDKANVEIPYYHSDDATEAVINIRGITHNGVQRSGLHKDKIYKVDINERWSAKRFTLPNVQLGSIVEYTYEIQSPFFFNLKGWDFQEDIPKVYTEYHAKIPGNWVYNRTLIGELGLTVNDAKVKKNCFSVPGIPNSASCEVLTYTMKDVPAFEEAEDYMLSGKNYRAGLKFELSEYHSFRGGISKYTKSWKDVDKEFRTDRDIGSQLKKKNFFEKNVPEGLLHNDADELTRAKNIYAFVKEHYTWNEKYGLWHDNRVKKAFDEHQGNVAEINITLINLLNAAGIKADMTLLATRGYGLPTMTHPVMSDFNYIVAKVDIDGKTYLLDATVKDLPFGMLPFKCLNYYGRVMDFDKESYWMDIEPEPKNSKVVRTQMSFDVEEGKAMGLFSVVSSGYESIDIRGELRSSTEEEYLDDLEEKIGDDFYITSYEVQEENSNEKRLSQKFGFEIENVLQGDRIYLDPFVVKFFGKNPFTTSKRYYPIDFGYLRNYGYSLNLIVPEGYTVKSLPEEKSMALPGNAGFLRFQCRPNGNGMVNVFFDLRLNATQYRSDAYDIIKEFFAHAVQAQTKSYVVLEKI